MTKVYYAHCMAIYGTLQEERDLTTIKKVFGEDIVNPSCDAISSQVKNLRSKLAAEGLSRDVQSTFVMNLFRELIQECDIFVFRALPDGRISSGVMKELRWAEEFGLPVFELPSNTVERELSLDATRQYLREIGQR